MPSIYSISKENERRLRKSITRSTWLLVLSATGLILGTVLFFFVPVPPDRLPHQTLYGALFVHIGGLWVVPIFTFIFLRKHMNTTRRVELYNRGLLIVQMSGEKNLLYTEIARVELLDDSALTSKRHLMLSLKDPRARELARIKDSLENFEYLSWELRQRVGLVQGTAADDFSADDRRARLRQRASRSRFNAISGLVLLLMGLAGTLITVHDYRLDRRLRTVGVAAEALIIDRYIYNDRAYRLEYAYRAADGRTYSRDLMLSREDWSRFQEGGTIAIRYLADDPELSLAPLEEEKGLGLFLVAGLIMLLCGVSNLAMGLTGCDLERIDGKFIFVRRGELMEDKLTR